MRKQGILYFYCEIINTDLSIQAFYFCIYCFAMRKERICFMKNSEYTQQINSLENGEIHLFAAANTYKGFRSCFEEIFEKSGLEKVYILKGGPGVGKSTLMKKAAFTASEKGMNPIYYHCSSDPGSLDGVIVPEKGCAILDGTAPHVFDPVYPGARDIIVNLGQAWNLDVLNQHKKSIIHLSDNKGMCYKAAYRLLSAAKSTDDEMREIGGRCMNTRKASVAAARIAAKHFGKNGSGKIKTVVCDAISCYGEVRYFCYEKQAEILYFVKDIKSTAGFFFDRLYDYALRSGIEMYAGIRPLCPDEKVCLYFPGIGMCISMYDDDFCRELDKKAKTYKIINLARFFDADKYRALRSKYKFAEKCYTALKEAAFGELAKAGAYHAELEQIYGKATDYKRVSEIGDSIINEIFS